MPVQFENQPTIKRSSKDRSSGISTKLISWGIAKDAKQANLILTIVVIIFFALSIYFSFFR